MFELFALFVERPWLAGAPALAFALAWLAARSRWAASAALGWALYGLYEAAMAARILCSGECNIRVDLLLLAPALLLASAIAVVATVLRLVRG